MKYALKLKIPVECDLLSQIKNQAADLTKLGHFSFDCSELPTELVQWLASLDLQVSHAEVFHTPPRSRLPIHADGPELSDIVKLNWCYGADGSMMNWFVMKDPSVVPQQKNTGIGTRYVQPAEYECRMVHSARIGQPSLVNVGQLHSVINPTAESRWVLSLVLEHNGTGLTWDQAALIFTRFR